MLNLLLLRVLHDKRVLHLHYRGHVLRQFLNHSALILRGGELTGRQTARKCVPCTSRMDDFNFLNCGREARELPDPNDLDLLRLHYGRVHQSRLLLLLGHAQ